MGHLIRYQCGGFVEYGGEAHCCGDLYEAVWPLKEGVRLHLGSSGYLRLTSPIFLLHACFHLHSITTKYLFHHDRH